MVDNMSKLIGFIKPETDDDFYYLQILQRKKENPQLGSNSRVIKNYYISSPQYLLDRYTEIKNLCTLFNARASLRLNKRSYRKTAFKAMQNIANTMSNGEFLFVRKSYDRACGLGHNDSDKKWILDIDGQVDLTWKAELFNYINSIEPIGKNDLVEIPSKSGIHIITKPFNLQKFKKDYKDIEIHKDNPTNLYIP